MSILYLDCSMGAAGDMLTAALLELLPDRDSFLQKLNSIGLPHTEVYAEPSVKCGIRGTHVAVKLHGDTEETSHDCHYELHHTHNHSHEHSHHDHAHHDHAHHDHAHSEHDNHDVHEYHDHAEHHDHHEYHDHTDHHDHHEHRALEDIFHLVSRLSVSEDVRKDILAVYTLLAQGESHVHGVPVDQIHFHEVGTLDALADIAAVCLLIHTLKPSKILASPVHVGKGQVRCAHGILPVPAPATAELLKGIPIYSGEIFGELCTPTGAALLKHFVKEFKPMPPMQPIAIGYGMGKKDFPIANCLRAILGEGTTQEDEILELSCNLDDMTPEDVGFAMELLLKKGALDVYTVPIGMKKSRPGVLLSVLCKPAQKETMVSILFAHTNTLGIRENPMHRYTLEREIRTVETEFGPVRCKISTGYGTEKQKYEADDLARIVRETGLPLSEIRSRLP